MKILHYGILQCFNLRFLQDIIFLEKMFKIMNRDTCTSLHKEHPVQEKTTLWVHPLKNDNVGSAQQTLWVQNGGKLLFFSMMNP